jgi:hypothetical protein
MNRLHMDTVKGQARDEPHQKIQPLRESLEELIVLWDDRPNQDNETAPHFSGGSSTSPTADVNSPPDIMYSSSSDSDDSRSRPSSPRTTNVFLEHFLRPRGSCGRGREMASKSVESMTAMVEERDRRIKSLERIIHYDTQIFTKVKYAIEYDKMAMEMNDAEQKRSSHKQNEVLEPNYISSNDYEIEFPKAEAGTFRP